MTEKRLTRPWESRYDIRNTTVLAETPDLRILDMTLLTGQSVPWHMHPVNGDTFIGLRGQFEIHVATESSPVVTGANQRYLVPAGVPHMVINTEQEPCQFLGIQGVGPYNYVPVAAPVQSVRARKDHHAPGPSPNQDRAPGRSFTVT